jgi:hypothetical protein
MGPTVSHPWPDALDLAATGTFLLVVLIVPTLGYVFIAIDLRAYVRSLKRGLVRIGQYVSFIPDWARYETPSSIAAFGLRLPCTEDDLKRAYRKRVKRLHPDHGGDQRRFLLMQAQFEQAMSIVTGHPTAD